jgi:predicted nucleotidyltransferase
MDIAARVTAVLEHYPSVERVELVGSRGRGDASALSDWDLQIHTTDADALARDLAALVAPLEPLAAQRARLGEHAARRRDRPDHDRRGRDRVPQRP